MLLIDSLLIKFFADSGKSLPFSVSTLRKDRGDGRLGLPYRRIGGSCLYCPAEVEAWLMALPVTIPSRPVPVKKSPGRPTKADQVKKARAAAIGGAK